MVRVLLGIGVVALVSTAGDYVWFEFGVRHRAVAGVVHGAVLLAAVGGALGAASGRLLAGLPAGAAAGVGGALAYYALAPLGGRAAMVAAWVLVWLLLAAFDGRIIQRPPRSWSAIGVRGVAAAVLAGLAFAAVVGSVWGRAPAGGRQYAWHFVAWVIAWAPGLLALTAGGRRGAAR